MITLNPYLTFAGNCEEAFNLYRKVFGGEFQFLGRYKDVPDSEKKNFEGERDEKIMHVSLPINSNTILMGCDNLSATGQTGSNIALTINADSRENADRIFNGLSAEGKIKMPMGETFWGAYFGMTTDKFGISWMISFDLKQQ